MSTQTFNRSRIVDIKDRLRELKIPFKSNLRKRDLYDLLAARQVAAPIETTVDNTAAIVKIQAAWRGRYTRKMLELRGNAAFNRQLCSNDIDPISLNPIEDLPMKFFFSYRAADGRYYGFDINSLKSVWTTPRRKIRSIGKRSLGGPCRTSTNVTVVRRPLRLPRRRPLPSVKEVDRSGKSTREIELSRSSTTSTCRAVSSWTRPGSSTWEGET